MTEDEIRASQELIRAQQPATEEPSPELLRRVIAGLRRLDDETCEDPTC